MKFIDFLNEELESNIGKTKDGLKFELREHSATVEFFEQFELNYNLFSEIYDSDKLSLSNDGVKYGYKLDAETAKKILSQSSPRKYISSEIARLIKTNSMLEKELEKFKIFLYDWSVKKNGREINIIACEKYNSSNVLGTLVIRNVGLTDVELQVGKDYKKIKLNDYLFVKDHKELANDIKEALKL